MVLVVVHLEAEHALEERVHVVGLGADDQVVDLARFDLAQDLDVRVGGGVPQQHLGSFPY